MTITTGCQTVRDRESDIVVVEDCATASIVGGFVPSVCEGHMAKIRFNNDDDKYFKNYSKYTINIKCH